MQELTPGPRTAAVLVTAVAAGLLLSGCADTGSTAGGSDSANASVFPTATTSTNPFVLWEPTPEEEQAVLDCAAAKLGYAYTLDDVVDVDMSDGEGTVDTEEEWEGQRMIHAYSQCKFETFPGEIDRDDGQVDLMYRSAYGIAWGEDEPREDNGLAPWPGKENLG